MKYNDNGEWKDIQVKVANAIQNEYGESNNDGYSQNYLNDKVVNVSTEVDEDYRVNLLKSRNMIDSSSLVAGDYSGQVPTTRVSTRQQLYLKAGTYTFSTNLNTSTYRYYINTLEGTPPNLTQKYNSGWQTGSSFTFTITNANEGYFVLVIGRVDSGTLSVSDVSSNQFMLNEGSTALSYSPFIQNQIVVDNDKFTDTLNVGTSVNNANRVNVLHSKNLFNYKDTSKILTNCIFNGSQMKIQSESNCNLSFIECKPNTTYTISRRSPMSNRFQVATSNSYPENGITILSLVSEIDNTTTSMTITTGANAKYIIIRFIYNLTGINYDDYAQTIQVEEGSTATSYEPYVVSSIYVDNEEIYSKDNIDIYSTNEIRIGTWIDGKPIYRTVYEKNNTTSGNTSYSITPPSNFRVITKLDIMQYTANEGSYIHDYYNSSSDYLRIFYSSQLIQVRTSKTSSYNHYITIEYTKTTDV